MFVVTIIVSAEDSAIRALCMLASALSLTIPVSMVLRLSHFVVQADWEPRIHLPAFHPPSSGCYRSVLTVNYTVRQITTWNEELF